MYQIIHLADLRHLEDAHKSLLSKNQVVSKYFRLMRRDGGYVWIQMQATLINNPRSMPKPLHIVGICVIIGDNQQDQSALLLEEPVSVAQTDAGRSNSNDTLESRRNHAGQRRKVMRTHSGSNSLLTIKDSDGKPILATHKRPVSKRKERSNLPVKRTKQSGEDSSNIMFKVIDENDNDASIRNESEMNPVVNMIDDSLRNGRPYNQTIGPMRRFSDDTCSVMSSMTSASTTSAAMIFNGGQIVVSCPPPSVSSCSSASSICSQSSQSLPRTCSGIRSNDHYLPIKLHQTLPLNQEAFTQMEPGRQEQQQHQYCISAMNAIGSDVNHIYKDHTQYQSNNYWLQENDGSSTDIYGSRCNDDIQFAAKQLQHTLPEQYYCNTDEQHLDTDNQSTNYYYYNSNETTIYTGPPNANVQLARIKGGIHNSFSDQQTHYQYPYHVANQTTRESMSVVPLSPVVVPCFVASDQSF